MLARASNIALSARMGSIWGAKLTSAKGGFSFGATDNSWPALDLQRSKRLLRHQRARNEIETRMVVDAGWPHDFQKTQKCYRMAVPEPFVRSCIQALCPHL
jgi:hypothetical protein